jgi:nucleotide-binding universal stress UspA family protein
MSVVGTKRTTRVAALMSAFEALRLAHSHKAEAHMICVEEIPGHSALYHRILGKTTDRLVELVPCAVLVVK